MFFNSGLGINIENDKISVVYLKGSFKGIQVAAQASSLLDESKPVSERMADAADFVNGFVREHKIPSIAIFIGIPGQYCVFREIELPAAAKENLRTTLEYEIEKYVPMKVEDIYFDYQVVAADKADNLLKVMIFVVKKEDVDPYVQLAQFLDRGISGIEIAPAAVSNYFFHQYGVTDNPAIIISATDSRIEIIYTHGRSLAYARSFDLPDQESALNPMVMSHLTRVVSMFPKNGEAVKLCVFGRAFDEDFICQLKEKFHFDILTRQEGGDEMAAVSSTVAAGLALKATQKLPVQMNIMPMNLRKKPDKTSMIVMIALTVILAASGLLWSVIHVINHRAVVAEMDSEIVRLKSEASEIDKMREEIKKYQDRIDYLFSLRPGNVYVADIGKELSERIPASAWVKELKLSGNQLMLYGIAETSSELIPILEDSPIFSDVKFLSAIRKGKDDKDIFRIGLTIGNKSINH